MNKILVISKKDLNLPSLENAKTIYCESFQDALDIGGDYVLYCDEHLDLSKQQVQDLWQNHKDETIFFAHENKGFSSFILKQVNAYSFRMIFEDAATSCAFMPFSAFSEYMQYIPKEFLLPESALVAGAKYSGVEIRWQQIDSSEGKINKDLITLVRHPFKALSTYRKADETFSAAYGEYKMPEKEKAALTLVDKLQLILSREMVTYIIFGVLTTIVNLVAFFLIDKALGKERFFGEQNYLISQVIAWVIAVVFAYITNKIWVFNSKSWKIKTVLYEFVTFTGARLFSFGVETAGMVLFVEKLGVGTGLSKIVMSIVTVILNYIFSKLIIFRKKDKQSKNTNK